MAGQSLSVFMYNIQQTSIISAKHWEFIRNNCLSQIRWKLVDGNKKETSPDDRPKQKFKFLENFIEHLFETIWMSNPIMPSTLHPQHN
jgi:hypothetical protein